ncbi:hypothetical protein BC629DRAFT_1574389 [Irpex lacteus]|nr:hypothetical protein BC629DRAFT_1574389 [Irpex lacteus]
MLVAWLRAPSSFGSQSLDLHLPTSQWPVIKRSAAWNSGVARSAGSRINRARVG